MPFGLEKKKILIISVSGIGNTILQIPLIRSIAAQASYKVDILFGNEAMASLLMDEKGIDHRFVLPQSLIQKMALVRRLRQIRYCFSVACFPSNRSEFHLLPFVIGAKKRVIHSYPCCSSPFAFLSNVKIGAVQGLHDVQQNLNLLDGLGAEPHKVHRGCKVEISQESKRAAADFLKSYGLTGTDLLGIHPGSGPIVGKRWPQEYFARTIERLVGKGHFSKALIFGGPEENHLKKRLLKMSSPEKALIVDTPFQVTAALIAKCRFMLSNDSGLMHVAAAVETPVLGIFGPTDWTRTAPHGRNAHFLKPSIVCAPCLDYPFKSKRARIKCSEHPPECLKEITPEKVVKRVETLLRKGKK